MRIKETYRGLIEANVDDASEVLVSRLRVAGRPDSTDIAYTPEVSKAYMKLADTIESEMKYIGEIREDVPFTGLTITNAEFMESQLYSALNFVEVMLNRIDEYREHNNYDVFSRDQVKVFDELYTNIQKYYHDMVRLSDTEIQKFRFNAVEFYTELKRVTENADGKEKEELDKLRRSVKRYLWPGVLKEE